MRKLPLFCLLTFIFAAATFAQPGKNLQPSTTHSLVVVQLRDFTKKPIPKAPLKVNAAEGNLEYTGKSDANGNWQCLLPINKTYWISVGDSANYSQVTVPNKPYSVTKHNVFFQGSVNGKPLPVGVPTFNMMPPSDGSAMIDMEFDGMDDLPLIHEKVTLTADGSKKVYIDSTDSNGRLTMKVPIGENYTMSLAYNSKFDHFNFPAHGGSYNARVRYKYAGKQAIEDLRAGRISSLHQYDSYDGLTRESQIKLRDVNGHKKVFKPIPTKNTKPPFKVVETNYGFSLALERNSPVVSPCYIDGKIVAGAGWDSDVLAAVDAQTGQAKWSISLEESGISNIEGGDDVVVCATESCTIYAIAAETGKLLWSKWLANYVLSAPCIADGRVYIGYEDEMGSQLFPEIAKGKPFSMACFDLKTGEIIWQQWIKGEVMSSPVADGKNLYFNTFSGFSYVLNREKGNVVSEQKLFGTSAPTIVNGQVCMSQRDAGNTVARERIALFDATNLSLIRATPFQDAPYLDPAAIEKTKFAATAANISLNTGSAGEPMAMVENFGPELLVGSLSIFTTQSWEGSRPLELNGKVYVAQGHVLRCLDAKTLAQVWEWQYPTSLSDDGGASMAPPIVVNGKVIVACMDGALREFDPANGRILNSYVTGEKHRQQPIAAKGNFYAPCVDGKLAVVKTGNAAIDKWYCWGGNAARTNRGH